MRHGLVNVSILITLFALLILLDICLPEDAGANPIPRPEKASQPYANITSPVIFRSEKVVYTIDEEHEARVDANYVLFNPSPNIVNLSIGLPFFGYVQNLSLKCNFESVDSIFGVDVPGLKYDTCAGFNVTLSGEDMVFISASYSLFLIVEHQFIFDTTETTYIARSGAFWNGTLERAEFVFKVNKDLMQIGLFGYSLSEQGEYYVGKKVFTDWEPNMDITASWARFEPLSTTFFIVNSCFIIITLIFLIRFRVRMNKVNNKDMSSEHRKQLIKKGTWGHIGIMGAIFSLNVAWFFLRTGTFCIFIPIGLISLTILILCLVNIFTIKKKLLTS